MMMAEYEKYWRAFQKDTSTKLCMSDGPYSRIGIETQDERDRIFKKTR